MNIPAESILPGKFLYRKRKPDEQHIHDRPGQDTEQGIAFPGLKRDYGGGADQVSVSLSCTFYETMVGGVPDQNLPAG